MKYLVRSYFYYYFLRFDIEEFRKVEPVLRYRFVCFDVTYGDFYRIIGPLILSACPI